MHGFESYFRVGGFARLLVLALATPLPSWLRVRLLRVLGARVGAGTRIYPFSILIAKQISIGNDTRILPFAVLLNLKHLEIGHRCYVHWGAMITGHGQGSLFLGDFSYIGLRAVVNCTEDVHVGAYTCIGPLCVIYTHGNFLPTLHGWRNKFAPVRIGTHSWLNVGVIVLPGVTIGDRAIVKAGCVVARDLGSDRMLQIDVEKSYLETDAAELGREPTPEAVARWYEQLFDQLAAHLGDESELHVEHPAPHEWQIRARGSRLRVLHVASADALPAAADAHETLLLIQGLGPAEKRALRDRNWIDFAANESHFAARHPLLPALLGYFELRKAMYLTRFRA